MGFLFKGLVRFYQYFISPIFPPMCRFYPSCSCYAIEAVDRYGFLKGVFFTFKRLMRCHPYCPGGYDPVKEID